jgi:hypothetical protein
MTTIRFKCSCGQRFLADIPPRNGLVEFYLQQLVPPRLHRTYDCPGCGRRLRQISAERFFAEMAPGWDGARE